MRVLLTVDNKRFSEESIKALSHQSNPSDTEVRVLHVIEPISVSVPPQMTVDFTPETASRVTEARGEVEEIAQRLRTAGFRAEGAVRKGEAREAILADAADWHPDLIVLGSHGHKGIRRFLLGSVAESVARNASCSVEIVRPPVA